MSIRSRILSTSPWALVTLVGLIGLTLVDVWRDQGPTRFSVLRGTLPNVIAVPTLTFAFLSMIYPKRPLRGSRSALAQDSRFWMLLGGTVLGLVVWEFLQRTGYLVFDPNDLVATAIGAALTAVLFYTLQGRSVSE